MQKCIFAIDTKTDKHLSNLLLISLVYGKIIIFFTTFRMTMNYVEFGRVGLVGGFAANQPHPKV